MKFVIRFVAALVPDQFCAILRYSPLWMHAIRRIEGALENIVAVIPVEYEPVFSLVSVAAREEDQGDF